MFYRKFLKLLEEKAQALVLSYMVIFVFIVITATLVSKAINEHNLARRNKLVQEAFYLAEGAAEDAIAAFTQAIANYQIVADVPSWAPPAAIYTTFANTSVSATVIRLEETERLVLEGQTNIMARNYEVVATALHPVYPGISVTIHQIIQRRLIPTFQHAVFYNDDLEVLPGANMNLSGRIHCNKDMYLDAEPGRTLTIDSFYVRSAGNIYNQRKDSGSAIGGEVNIRQTKPGAPKYEPMNNLDSENPNWITESINRWKGTVQNSVHGVTELSTPSVASIQPGEYYANNAGVIVQNASIVRSGMILTEGIDYPPGTITTTTSFYNNREGKYIEMTNIDLGKLANADGAISPITSEPYPNNLPENGLLYASRDDTMVYEPGFRLVNADEIVRQGGLTLVSNDPVYVQGDYNTVGKKPASIICDSLNLLSNDWNDSRSGLSVNSRVASVTTVNCAFIAGINNTSSGNYNGGLENYPRLHEKWSGIDLNIQGSFVALWNSAVATGSWQYGDPQYTAPRRNWAYDTDFNNPANLPPFTPWAVEARRIAWWKE